MSYHINLEGLISYPSPSKQKEVVSYAQFYRKGILEIVDSFVIDKNKNGNPEINRDYESKVLKNIEENLLKFKKLGAQTPIFIFITFLNVKKLKINLNHNSSKDQPMEFNRDILSPGEVILESFDQKIPQVLKPVFDQIWNACGYERSLNYDKNGDSLMEY